MSAIQKIFFLLAAALAAGLAPAESPLATPVPAMVGAAAWIDEFAGQDSRWAWNYFAGAGYRLLGPVDGAATAVEIGITSAATASSYSDCSLHEKTYPYTTGALEMRLRTTDDNGLSGPGQGTRGWGFWDGGPNAAWFWSASPESDLQVSGFRVQVVRDGQLRYNEILPGIDMRDWHVYRVELLPQEVKYYVDGVLIAATSERPGNALRAELWIDNYLITLTEEGYSTAFLDVGQDQKMYVDWIRYTDTADSDPDPLPNRVFLPLLSIHSW